jgi:hypothetical protein
VSEASPITCFACDREPTQQCSRCGRPYCDEHGEELCDFCMQPSTGVPSFSLYRGSLLALLVVTALAVWLIVQPSSSEGDDTALVPVVTPTAAVAGGQPTSAAGTPAPGTTAAATGTPGTPVTTGTGTPPAGTTTPRPTGTVQATPPLSGTPGTVSGAYTVVSGDTLSGICSAQRPALSNADCVASIRSLNNLSTDALSVGQSLRLP